MILFLQVSSVIVTLPIIGWGHAVLGQLVAEVAARERAFGSLLAVDQQVVQIQDLPVWAVVAVVRVVVPLIRLRDNNVVSELVVVGEFVDGVGNVVCLDNETAL
jgi:hypothetical protein